jgi:hypothetical protein
MQRAQQQIVFNRLYNMGSEPSECILLVVSEKVLCDTQKRLKTNKNYQQQTNRDKNFD